MARVTGLTAGGGSTRRRRKLKRGSSNGFEPAQRISVWIKASKLRASRLAATPGLLGQEGQQHGGSELRRGVSAARRGKPLDRKTLDVAVGRNKPTRHGAEKAAERLRKPEGGT
jgi:hypothetical protein